MTPILLMKAVKAFLEQELGGDATTVPAVHLGYLPEKTAANRLNEEYPFILLRPQEGEDTEDGYRVKLLMLFATKADDEAGFLDVLNLMERIRIKLLKKRLVDSRFRLEMPYKWKFYDEQAEPEWFGEAVTTWTLPHVLEEVDYG
jgi:hypothetical protein